MDWDKFTFEHRLVLSDFMGDLISIEASRESAMNLVLPPDWREQLDRLNRVRAVHGTTALEGNPLSEAEVSHQMDILEEQVESETHALSNEQRQIRNAGRAQDWVRERFEPGCAPFSGSDILQMHKLLTEKSDENHNVPGEFREHSVVVGSEALGGVHKCAPHESIPKLMDQYIEFVNSRQMVSYHPVIRALLAHYYLVTIHPFGDGNGRISRLVEAGILFQGGYNVFGFYGLSNYFYRNGDQYKKTLQKCREEQPFNVSPFIEFGLFGFAEELKGINNFIKSKLNRVVYRAMLVRAFNTKTGVRRRIINKREYNLLTYLIGQTEPIDPFSQNPSRQIEFDELKDSPYIQQAYKDVTNRTFWRELLRLSQMHFVKFTSDDSHDGPLVELDFDAIGLY